MTAARGSESKAVAELERMAAAVLSGEPRALARAITLVESSRAEHRLKAEALLARLMPSAGRSIRLGITGVPGVGKSTFIEGFGLHLIAAGHRVAVLAVDPSSKRGGGSILGDKTRMERLAVAEGSFIRPSPAGASLGGVARRTREAILVVEAAGFDVVIVETVGVGQSETAVADMVDMFVLLISPAGGDELQGLKRGIVELADMILVNKADGALAAAANRAAADYRRALQLIIPRSRHWRAPVRLCSAASGAGIAEAWQAVEQYRAALEAAGELAARRVEHGRAWLWHELSDGLLAELRSDPAIAAATRRYEGQVAAGKLSPSAAARRLLAAFRGRGLS